MSFNKDIADVRTRIAKARSDRDACRISGKRQKYFESYLTVEALEVELERLRRQGVLSLAAERAG